MATAFLCRGEKWEQPKHSLGGMGYIIFSTFSLFEQFPPPLPPLPVSLCLSAWTWCGGWVWWEGPRIGIRVGKKPKEHESMRNVYRSLWGWSWKWEKTRSLAKTKPNQTKNPAFLRYNSHTISLTHLKYTFQCFLVCSQSCATITIINPW